jgi:hypothetical protein
MIPSKSTFMSHLLITRKKIINVFLPGFTVLILILISTATFAQKFSALEKVYLEAGVGGSSHKGILASAGVQAVWKNNWVTGFSYHSIDMQPKNLPGNYHPGYTIIFFIPIPDQMPSADMRIYSLMAGKQLKAGRNTWFITNAGLSLVNANELQFTRSSIDPSWNWFFGEEPSNYTYTKQKKTTFGAMLNADFNWAFASFAGLGAGVFTNFNSIQSPVGYHIKLLIGKTNREKRNRS